MQDRLENRNHRKRVRNGLIGVLVLLLALPGCTVRTGADEVSMPPETAAESPSAPEREPVGAENAPEDPEEVAGPRYIDSLVEAAVAGILQPGMGEFERVKAAFDYMIETATLLDPVGLELWRVHDSDPTPPPFVENRSLSILLFQLGKCEDYAAAMTMLLRGMGLEAEYVPGLTFSTQGALVDHAWTVVKVDGTWYHVDCQLEQNISRHGSIRYKYFMRSDATMADSHRWGRNLIQTGLLRAEQNEEIEAGYIPPECPADYPTPERHAFTPADPPDLAAIQATIQEQLREYEERNGPLEPLELNTVPPVFGLEGYGPSD